MKRNLILALAVGLAMTLIPAAWCANKGGGAAAQEPQTQVPVPEAEETLENETVSVYLAEAGETRTLAMRDYIISAVAGEMPAVYAPEALKAQALASVTLTRYMKRHNQNNGALSGAVISTDPRQYQGYLSVAEMRARWGENFDAYYKKLCDAVDAVLPLVIVYEGEPILAAFHAVSSGVTETSETVWNKALPYLINCESEGDKLSPGYASSETVSPETLLETLSLTAPEELSPEAWLGDPVYSEAGTLLQMEICGEPFTGFQLREAFSLRSAAIRLTYASDAFEFFVTGYGHGVGLSQYGADYYARQGMDYTEIIAHYYPGTEIAPAF